MEKKKITEFDIYTAVDNVNVTNSYLRIIEHSLNSMGYKTNDIDDIVKLKENKNKGIIAIAPGIAIKAKKAGYKTIIYWSQGIVPEESFLRHRDSIDRYFRYIILSYREKKALSIADFVLFVSESMKYHYQKKYKLHFDKYYVMPCFNETIHRYAFFTENKYSNNVFTYAGSLDPWQCFEPTLKVFSEIESVVPNAHFRVLTSKKEEAEKLIKKYEIKNYSIDFVPKEKVADELAKAKFGFCLRKESPINRVATPTKLSSYICSGVIPIYTNVLEDFHSKAEGCEFCINVDVNVTKEDLLPIIELCSPKIVAEQVLSSFESHFGSYYSESFHEEKLKERLGCIY